MERKDGMRQQSTNETTQSFMSEDLVTMNGQSDSVSTRDFLDDSRRPLKQCFQSLL